MTAGVKGLARLKSEVARFRPFLSSFSFILPLALILLAALATRTSFAVGDRALEPGLPKLGPLVPNLCTPPGESVPGVEAPDRLTVTAFAIASMVRDTGPGVGTTGMILAGG